MTIWTTRTLLYSFGTICPEVSPAAYTGRLFLCPGKSRRNGGLYGIFRIRYHHFADPCYRAWARTSAFGALSICWRATARTTLARMLMYGKEASDRKQEIDRQHHTIPNQRNQRPKDKQRGNVYNLLFRHGKVRSQNMEKLKCSFPSANRLSHNSIR